MSTFVFSVLFVIFLEISVAVRFWLSSRQIRHVIGHRSAVPVEFAEKISLAAHQRAADYTVAKSKFSMLSMLINTVVLISLTLLGGLQLLSNIVFHWTCPGMLYQLSLLVAFLTISSLIDLQLDYYNRFVLEARFGFNKMTLKLFFTGILKTTLISVAIGLPLAWVVLQLMEKSGDLWWFYAWLVFSGFQLLMLLLYPTLIVPLFNKFTPLTDDSLRDRIESLMKRIGFASKGLFVMDSSKSRAHGNAYFSGFGAGKRIIFFDTVLARLEPQEIEAVLAHELGHFKLRHIVKRIVVMFVISLAFMALLGYLKQQVWFYTGLGVNPLLLNDLSNNNAMALILFMLALPIFTFLLSPLSSISSRKYEFEADAFAAKHTDANDLVTALVKLHKNNASTLTPDPLHSAFYDSHPPAAVRINKLTAAHG